MVLVTGGTGFLGAYIIKHLVDKGYAVRALRRETSQLPAFIPAEIVKRVEWFDGDILDVFSLRDAMEGIDTVIHAAAKVSFQPDHRQEMFQVNVEGTANVVNMAIEMNIKKLVHLSSVASLGRTMQGETVNEEKDWDDSFINTAYAISKHRGEMEVWRGAGEGLDCVILNPSTILGYGDWNNSSSRLFKNVYDEFPYYTNGMNGFVYVEDVAAAVLALLESGISMQRFIISSENRTFKQVFDAIADGFNKKRPSRNATPFLSQVAWRMEKLKSLFTGHTPLLSKETARIAQTETYFDSSKILNALPEFRFTPISEAVNESCVLYLRNLEQQRSN
ncbi:MAG: NAD-dependent epimerase/dehydratase family protein [Chitinophagaceae bacterium]